MDDPTSLQYNAFKLLRVQQSERYVITNAMGLSQLDVADYVQLLRQWYDKEPHLPEQTLIDEIMVGHLFNKKFSLERTKQMYDSYISARSRLPEYLMNRDPCSEEIATAFRCNQVLVLPERTEDKHRVTILKPLSGPDWIFSSAMKISFLIGEYRLMNDAKTGEQIVVDLQMCTVKDLVQCTPAVVSRALFYIQACAGMALKGIHFVHAPPFFVPVINIVKKILSSKLLERVHVHESYEGLMKLLPRKIFPSDFGGEDVNSKEITESWLQTLQAPGWRQWILDQDLLLVDEAKRKEKCAKLDDLFGADGSFRKLNLD